MVPLAIEQAFALALQHHQAGRLREAEGLYRRILSQQPTHADAMHFLGVIAHQTGHSTAAVDLIRQAIALDPHASGAYSNLGDALGAVGKWDQAIAACRTAVLLDPTCVEAYNNLGNALAAKGVLDEAVAAFGKAIALRPDFAQAHNNLGAALKAKGNFEQAAAAFGRAIALRPNDAKTHSNLASVLKEMGEIDQAIAACQAATALDPNFAEAYNNLGAALKDGGQLDQAIAAFRQATMIRPDFSQADSNLVFALHFHAGFSARQIAEEHRRWNRRHAEGLAPARAEAESTSVAESVQNPDPGLPATAIKEAESHSQALSMRGDALRDDRARRLRIGYVSPDFRDHVVGRNVLPLFRQHDRQAFEIFAYSNSPIVDGMTQEFQRLSDGWRNIAGVSDEQAAQQIRDDRIDILVDLALHTAGNRLLVFARKPAPVQVTFAGYPASTGLTAIDYRVSDPYLDPFDQAHGGPSGTHESIYTEKTIRLPGSFWCYDPLDMADISVSPLPAMKTGMITFGCLSNFCKINEMSLALWAQVLGQVEDSRLMMLAPSGSPRQRMLDFLHGRGIDPRRVELVPRQSRRSYLELYHGIDIGLDTFPYNGHTTSLDGFWMGVPTVTLVGQTTVSRAGWSQASNLRLPELAAHTPERFVTIAAELADDLPRLQDLRSTLRKRMEQSPLMDAKKFASSIEAAYGRMWRAWSENAS